ncbi:MAG: class I tRNA ligase family protein [Patescibacteria group bacterium]|nr:class I tRNA ligase family protein [Patescibacteria group bacterium]
MDEVRFLVDKKINSYEFSAAGEILRDFTCDKFADWYLEIAKIEGDKSNILIYVLKNLLILWHPFMPFVTEAIWQEMGNSEFLMVEKWSKVGSSISVGVDVRDGGGVLRKDEMNLIKDIIISIRNARAENKVEPGKKVKAIIYAGRLKNLVESQVDLIKGLRTGISELEIKENGPKIKNEIYLTVAGVEIYLIGAIDREKEKERIKKEIANLKKMISLTEKKLENKEFTAKAPAEIVKKEEEKLKSWQEALEKLKK